MDDKNFITDAFKSLSSLDEDIFKVNKEGIEELKNFKEDDDEVIDIIDDQASSEEELDDNYVGKIILDCNVCHSKIYKDESEVKIDEETENANIDEECPWCYSTQGYKVVGRVVPYGEDHCEESCDNKIKDNTELDESYYDSYSTIVSDIVDAVKERIDDAKDRDDSYDISDIVFEEMNNKLIYTADQWAIIEEFLDPEELINRDDVIDGLLNSIYSELGDYGMDESLSSKKIKNKISEKLKSKKNTEKLKEDYDVRKYTNKVFEYLDNGIFDPMDVCESLLKYMSEDDVKDWAEYNGYLSDEDFEEDNEEIEESLETKDIKTESVGQDLTRYQKWVDYDMKRYGRISDITNRKLKRAGLEVVKDKYGDYEVIAKEDNGKDIQEAHKYPRRKRESLEEVCVETDTQKIKVSEDKTVIENKEDNKESEEIYKEEVIEPVTEEEKEEIIDRSNAVSDDDITEFEEEDFDELVESFLKRTYSNVRKYKTESISKTEKGFLVEGIISFNSGKKKPTTFTFNRNRFNKATNKISYLGENLSLSKDKNTLSFIAKKTNNKLICESFSYNYNVNKDKCKGTIKNHKKTR